MIKLASCCALGVHLDEKELSFMSTGYRQIDIKCFIRTIYMEYILAKAEKNRKENKKGHTDTRQHRTD